MRYLPDNYRKTRIQVFVPDNVGNRSATDTAQNYVVFDPASMLVVPANSNAQRLGVGGPVRDVVRSVIKIISKEKKAPQQPAPPVPQPPKTTTHPGT